VLILKGLGRKRLNVWTSKCLNVELGQEAKTEDDLTERRGVRRGNAETGMAEWSGPSLRVLWVNESGVGLSKNMLL
jgi:hypothetical protein